MAKIYLTKDESNGEAIHTNKPKLCRYEGVDKTKPCIAIDDNFTKVITYPAKTILCFYWDSYDDFDNHICVPDGTIKLFTGKDINKGEMIEIEVKE
jgi:hypothetical protein